MANHHVQNLRLSYAQGWGHELKVLVLLFWLANCQSIWHYMFQGCTQNNQAQKQAHLLYTTYKLQWSHTGFHYFQMQYRCIFWLASLCSQTVPTWRLLYPNGLWTSLHVMAHCPHNTFPVRSAVAARFHRHHAKAGSVIKRAFDIMKSSWRSIFLKAVEVNPAFAEKVIAWCVIFHIFSLSDK